MSTWSARRKATYLSIFFGIIFLLIIVPAFFIFYRQPTCYDGKMNGDEKGVDCGGSCQLLCSADSVEPGIVWSRAFKVKDGVYSAVAYVENRNISSEAEAAYVFRFYDNNNALITTREGKTFIPKNRTLAVFESDIQTAERMPYRVSFEFVGDIVWKRSFAQEAQINVTNTSITGEDTRPRIDATIQNQSLETIPSVEAVAIVYDSDENAIAASRTFVENLTKDQAVPVTFTWPIPFQTREEICRVSGNGVVGNVQESLGVMIAIDRSGSMTALSQNPPQPLTDVKNAALAFVDQLKGSDEIGLVSFATSASAPIDAALSQNYQRVKDSIQRISILPSGTQYTNLGDGIEKAAQELLSPAKGALTNKVLIVLTDGEATRPEKPLEPSYPSVYAREKAEAAKKSGIELYIIGLGNEVNKTFLESIATTPSHYFAAPSAGDLSTIYNQIAVRICKIGPSVIEIIPKVIPRNL